MNSTNATSANTSVEAAAAPMPTAATTPEPTFTLTQSELRCVMADLLAQAVATRPVTVTASEVPAATPEPRPSTQPEACSTHRFLSLLEQATSKVIQGARDHVAVPANIYLVDKATPQGLALIAAGSIIAASGARRVSDYFARLAESAAAKSAALTRR